MITGKPLKTFSVPPFLMYLPAFRSGNAFIYHKLRYPTHAAKVYKVTTKVERRSRNRISESWVCLF